MHGIAVAVLTEDREHLSELQSRLEATHLARVVFTQRRLSYWTHALHLAPDSGSAG